ncbi:MAG: hypothetical protein ACQEP6_01690 [Patescibacteria group bacterium]
MKVKGKPVEVELRVDLIRENIKHLKDKIKGASSEDAYKKYKFHLTRAKKARKRLLRDSQAHEPVK